MKTVTSVLLFLDLLKIRINGTFSPWFYVSGTGFSPVVYASGQPGHLFYFWVAALGLREGNFPLAEKAKTCLFIPFVVALIQEELLRKTRAVRL